MHSEFDRRFAHTQTGFTLSELMVTLTLVAILCSIGVPSFRNVTTGNRLSAEVNALLGDLQLARAEAIREGAAVVVCASSDGATCSGSTEWKSGWIVWNDPNGNGSIDTGEAVLHQQQALNSQDTVQASNEISQITFNREGFATGIPDGTVLTLHDSTANRRYTRCLQVTLVGKMTTQTHDSDASCQ